MSSVIIAGDDGRMYRISRDHLDQYEVDEDDSVRKHHGTAQKMIQATKDADHPVADACWIAFADAASSEPDGSGSGG